jgi:hypothetical protein
MNAFCYRDWSMAWCIAVRSASHTCREEKDGFLARVAAEGGVELPKVNDKQRLIHQSTPASHARAPWPVRYITQATARLMMGNFRLNRTPASITASMDRSQQADDDAADVRGRCRRALALLCLCAPTTRDRIGGRFFSGACRRAQLQRTEKTSRAHKRSDGASETSGARPVRAAARERPRPMVRG